MSVQQTAYDSQGVPQTQVNVTVARQERNPLGTAGFVLALVGVFLSWIPFLGWILWLLGAIFSVVGIFRKPRGLAIAGTVISFFDLILVFVLASVIAGSIAAFSM